MNIIQVKFREFGIPLKEPQFSEIPDYNRSYAKHFVIDRGNLVVIGDNYYKKCIKLMYLHWVSNHMDMIWLTQSQLSFRDKDIRPEVLALVQLHSENDATINLPAAVVSNAMRSGSVLLGCNNVDDLENAFPNDLDMIEYNFEVWKEK